MNDWSDAEDHVERAHELFDAGRWDEAERELRRALEVHPDRAEWHFNLGMTLEQAGRYKDALDAFSHAHRLTPGDPQAMLAMAVNHIRLDDPQPAADLLKVVQRLAPDRADAFIYAIEAHARLGDHDEAELMFYRALQLEGDHALAYANMGESLIDRREWERAEACLREALKLDGGLPRVAARLAYVRDHQGHRDEARQFYLRELRSNPGDIDSLLDYGCLLADMGRLGDAGEKFRRVLELDPGQADACFYLGKIAEQTGRAPAAIRHYRRALKSDKAHPEARRRLARVLLSQGDRHRCRKLLEAERQRFRSDSTRFGIEDLREFGLILMDAGLSRAAVSVFGDLRRRTPEDPQAWHHFAVACFESGMHHLGTVASRRAIRLDPQLMPAWHNLALDAIRDRRWARAKLCLNRARALAPRDASVRRLVAAYRLQRLLAIFGLRWRAGQGD